MLSPPCATGALQPNTASLALHGVSRSICARTMPARKSAARAGSSSGRNRKRFGCSTISTRLPRKVGLRQVVAGDRSVGEAHARWRVVGARPFEYEATGIVLDQP